MRQTGLAFFAAMLLAGCEAIGPSLDQQVQAAVRETLAAMPTETPKPIPSPLPTATTLPLQGLFCEYRFCIGHPPDVAFYDVVAKQNPYSPKASADDEGILAANNNSLFIELMWQDAPSGSDGQFMLDLVLDSRVDSRSGDVQPLVLRELNVFFVPIGTSATPALPYGGAAAWTCAGRAFAWKAYTTQPDLAKDLLTEALGIFRCDG